MHLSPPLDPNAQPQLTAPLDDTSLNEVGL